MKKITLPRRDPSDGGEGGRSKAFANGSLSEKRLIRGEYEIITNIDFHT